MLHSAVITDPRRSVFAVVDLGSTKIVCFIVKVCYNNTLEVIGIGYKAAEGISGGTITDMQRASYSILSCIKSAKQMAQDPIITQVFVNVSGCDVCSNNVTNGIRSAIHEFSDIDVRNVMLQTYDKCREGQAIIHNIPIVYHLDNLHNITELKGLYGSNLKVDVHVVTVSKFALLNIENCMANCNLSVAGCVAESYASGLSCITNDERELGTMIIDIGGRYTSIGIFNNGKFVYADSIPLGGMHITNDIAYGLCVSTRDAERIKVLYGDTILMSSDKDGVIEADIGEEDEIISIVRSDLVKIIRPRVEEIFDIVKSRVVKQKHLINRVVITGGSSQLTNLKEIAGYVLKKQVRIGLPVELKGINDYKSNPAFSAAIGAALLIFNATLYKKREAVPKENNILKKFLKLIPIKIDNSM